MNTIDLRLQVPSGFGAVALAIVVVATLALAGCHKGDDHDEHAAEGGHAEHAGEKKEEHAEAEALTLTAEEAERAGVKVEEVKAQSRAETLVVTASIQADQERLARVGPRIEGRITSVSARLGDQVRAGQALARLESVAVGEAHAAWVQARSDLQTAEADFKRARALDADEIIPRKDFVRAQADRDKAAAGMRAAADRLRLLGGSTNAVDANVSSFLVAAPFDGTVVEKKATLGDLATPGEPMFTVADLSRVWIQADLPESALAKVRVGATAKVAVPAYPAESFDGQVGYIGAAVSKETRTVAARIEVANIDGRLKPEMFATATIDVDADRREVIALPDAAIVLMQGQPTVFIRERGAYEMRVVEPGERAGGRTVVRSGISPGEEVVTGGAYALKARKLKSQLGHGH